MSCLRGVVVIGAILWPLMAIAQDTSTIQAARTPTPVRIDGRLDDVAWQQARVVTGFIQRQPDEGRPAREQTELQIAYDDSAI